MSAKNKLLASALWYARHGWFVVPLHAPLFANGRLIGCTCEQWRRENTDANYTCRTPGKHPRMNEWEAKATLDPEQITRWWRVWPTANIGIAAGRSGLICLDADTYKDGGGEWDREWGETVTSLTGGGGEHLIYVHPDGEPLGNHQTGLPAWVDVRGHGGQFVAPPSLHPSGKRYEWEVGLASGQPLSGLFQDFDWADEVLHAQIGRRWYVPRYSSLNQALEYGDRCWSKVLSHWREYREQGLTAHRNWWPELYSLACERWGKTPDPAALAFAETYENSRADLQKLG